MLHFCLYKPCAMCLILLHFQPCAGSEPDCNGLCANKYTYMQLRSPSLCKFRYVSWFTMAQYSIHVLKHRRCSIHSYTQMHSYTHTLHTNTHTHTHTYIFIAHYCKCAETTLTQAVASIIKCEWEGARISLSISVNGTVS